MSQLIDCDTIAVVVSSASAVFSAIVGFGFKVSDYIISARARKTELYAEHCKNAYDAFIRAYSNLHRVKNDEEQRAFICALYSAISVAPYDLRRELKKLLTMNSTDTIKPTAENREVFYQCLELIGRQNAKKLL